MIPPMRTADWTYHRIADLYSYLIHSCIQLCIEGDRFKQGVWTGSGYRWDRNTPVLRHAGLHPRREIHVQESAVAGPVGGVQGGRDALWSAESGVPPVRFEASSGAAVAPSGVHRDRVGRPHKRAGLRTCRTRRLTCGYGAAPGDRMCLHVSVLLVGIARWYCCGCCICHRRCCAFEYRVEITHIHSRKCLNNMYLAIVWSRRVEGY